ncbi:Chitin deacetylase [Sphaceloma murrayae]|uniref:Chitin deacetylase n=1 Tax=Sphaceloma murrayae TaxID=2082308 RepID=A0A2K1R235_9PEZI|nr:Chitin deacetylase [Sphaceloma murrayae]
MVRLPPAFTTFAALLASTQAQQTITVTTKICSTSPTSSRSTTTTTVSSVVPVYPVEWNDQIANGGVPFVIRIELRDPSGYQDQSSYAAPSWLLPNGNTTTTPARAGQYRLLNGQLASVDGQYVSSEVGTSVEPLAVSSTVRAISRTFQSANGSLVWRNGNFTNGYAQFYKLPPNLLENARILAKLVGPMEPERSWSAVRLAAEPVPSDVQPSGGYQSYPYGQSTRSSTVLSSVATGAPPAYTGSPYQPGQSSSPASGSASPSNTAGSSTSSPSPRPSNATPDGSCGPDNGYTCLGAYSGDCCSVYGFCGASADYCGAGCQIGYGLCDREPGSYTSGSSSLSSSSSSLSGNASPSGPSSSLPTSSPPGYASSTAGSSSSLPGNTSAWSSSSTVSSSTTPILSLSGYPSGSVPTSNYVVPSSTPNPNQQESASTVTPSTSAPLPSYPPGTEPVDTPAECPVDSGTVVRDSNGIEYRLGCNLDSLPNSYQAIESPGDFNYCFEYCDNSPNCAGFTFTGLPNGQGPGSCFLKAGPVQFGPSNPNLVSAIRITPGSGSSTRSMEMTMSMSSGPTGSASMILSSSSSGLVGYTGGSSSSSIVTSSSSGSSISLPGYTEPTTSSGTSITSTVSLPDYAGPSSQSSSTTVSSSSPTSISLTDYVGPTTSSAPSTTPSTPTNTGLPGYPISTDEDKCPSIDGEIVSDAQGYQYNVTCQADSDGGSFRTVPASGGGLQYCLAQCSNEDTCNGLTYFADETQEDGNCYLKREPGDVFRTNSPYLQVAIRIPGGPVTATTTTATATTASSTTAAPTAYTGEPTPTPCPIVQNYGTLDDTDDGYCELVLPFDMRIYETTTRDVFPSSNGILSLQEGTTAYDVLPFPDPELPPTTLAPFFDDLYIYLSRTSDTTPQTPSATTGLPQGIYYTLTPRTTPTALNVTWILSRAGTYETYIFSLLYDALVPGVVTYEYAVTGGRGSGTTAGGGQGDESSNDGATAGIGVQGEREDGASDHVQWSYLEGTVGPGFRIVCDTNVSPGTCTGSDGVVVAGATTTEE